MNDEKKRQIYQGVISLIQSGRPLNELKVSEIAAASGIGKGTCYEYFRSKEEIIRNTLLYCFHQSFGSLCGTQQFEADFEAGFKTTLRQLAAAMNSFSPLQTLMSSMGRREMIGYLGEELLQEIMTQMTVMTDRILDAASSKGIISVRHDREYQRFVLMGMFQAFSFECVTPRCESELEKLMNFAYQGFREALRAQA